MCGGGSEKAREIFSIRTDGGSQSVELGRRVPAGCGSRMEAKGCLALRSLPLPPTLTAFIAAPMICSLYGRVMLCCKAPDPTDGRTETIIHGKKNIGAKGEENISERREKWRSLKILFRGHVQYTVQAYNISAKDTTALVDGRAPNF